MLVCGVADDVLRQAAFDHLKTKCNEAAEARSNKIEQVSRCGMLLGLVSVVYC